MVGIPAMSYRQYLLRVSKHAGEALQRASSSFTFSSSTPDISELTKVSGSVGVAIEYADDSGRADGAAAAVPAMPSSSNNTLQQQLIPKPASSAAALDRVASASNSSCNGGAGAASCPPCPVAATAPAAASGATINADSSSRLAEVENSWYMAQLLSGEDAVYIQSDAGSVASDEDNIKNGKNHNEFCSTENKDAGVSGIAVKRSVMSGHSDNKFHTAFINSSDEMCRNKFAKLHPVHSNFESSELPTVSTQSAACSAPLDSDDESGYVKLMKHRSNSDSSDCSDTDAPLCQDLQLSLRDRSSFDNPSFKLMAKDRKLRSGIRPLMSGYCGHENYTALFELRSIHSTKEDPLSLTETGATEEGCDRGSELLLKSARYKMLENAYDETSPYTGSDGDCRNSALQAPPEFEACRNPVYRVYGCEGWTDFKSVDDLCLFIRRLVSTIGGRALQDAQFMVPVSEAQKLLDLLVEVSPFEVNDVYRAIKSGATSLGFVVSAQLFIMQLPQVLGYLCGTAEAAVAAAEAAAAAAATETAVAAVAEAATTAAAAGSGSTVLSAVCAATPWVVLIGGVLYAVVFAFKEYKLARMGRVSCVTDPNDLNDVDGLEAGEGFLGPGLCVIKWGNTDP